MGRNRKVPLKNGKIVNVSQVGPDSNTPYHPRDVNTAVCQRLFGADSVPKYRGEGESGANV